MSIILYEADYFDIHAGTQDKRLEEGNFELQFKDIKAYGQAHDHFQGNQA